MPGILGGCGGGEAIAAARGLGDMDMKGSDCNGLSDDIALNEANMEKGSTTPGIEKTGDSGIKEPGSKKLAGDVFKKDAWLCKGWV